MARRSQDQRSLRDQLEDTANLAEDYGMYDAADWIRQRIPRAVAVELRIVGEGDYAHIVGRELYDK